MLCYVYFTTIKDWGEKKGIPAERESSSSGSPGVAGNLGLASVFQAGLGIWLRPARHC